MGVVVSSEVDKFLEDRVEDISKNVSEKSCPKHPSCPSGPSSLRSLSKAPLSHGSSIRDLALCHQKRLNGNGSSSSSFSSSKFLLEREPKKKFPMLKLKIDSIQDDVDWIQVEEDETDEELSNSPRKPNDLYKKSYLFTSSGTMLIAGFSPGIGERGLKLVDNDLEYVHKIPMHERLVILSKLGSGSTSVVYKAFDLQEMRLVALKKISVSDKAKRRQMIKEISTLMTMFSRRPQQSRDHHLRLGRSVTREFPTIYETSNGGSADDYDDRPSEESFSENIVEFHDAFSNLDDCSIMIMMEYMVGLKHYTGIAYILCRMEGLFRTSLIMGGAKKRLS